MTNRELLEAYREAMIDLQELSIQLERICRSGAPQGATSIRLDAIRGTNNHLAASIQLADGIGAMIERKREELLGLSQPVSTLLAGIGDPKTLFIVQNYYLNADTDANIARELRMSRCRVNQIRNRYLALVS